MYSYFYYFFMNSRSKVTKKNRKNFSFRCKYNQRKEKKTIFHSMAAKPDVSGAGGSPLSVVRSSLWSGAGGTSLCSGAGGSLLSVVFCKEFSIFHFSFSFSSEIGLVRPHFFSGQRKFSLWPGIFMRFFFDAEKKHDTPIIVHNFVKKFLFFHF